MPTNKNALIRYKYLDRFLSDRYHYYDIHDLTDGVNESLRFDGFLEVTQRCIEKDINALEDAPFNAPITRFVKNGKNCIAYGKLSFSIFKQEMRREERLLLHEVLNTIGQFNGLDHFAWLNRLKADAEVRTRRQIISFSNNPYLKNSNLLGTLFDYISNKVVIRLSYHTYSDESIRSIEFHPYLLKQYNDRWFLLGAADSDKKILTFALDRIDEVEPLPEKKYQKCPEDLSERFEDIVGVTLYEDRPVEHILCWASDASKSYAIHGSYTPIKGEREQLLREEYPQLQGGMFFTLDCISNYELIRELCSYGKDLIVLHSDGTIADDVYKRICEIYGKYSELSKLKV